MTRREKKEVRELLYEYKDMFSLRDETETCPYTEVEIDITDKTPFFIRLFHAKEEDKAILHKEMKRLCYLGIFKKKDFQLILVQACWLAEKWHKIKELWWTSGIWSG